MTPLGDATPNPDDAGFRISDRAGPNILSGLLADLALLEGEATRLRDNRFAWAVNRLGGCRTVPSCGRMCLVKPGRRGRARTVLDGLPAPGAAARARRFRYDTIVSDVKRNPTASEEWRPSATVCKACTSERLARRSGLRRRSA